MTAATTLPGPDFVCIGAQKAGTTWLYDNLVSQPGVWMPPEKEIHFFNTVCPHEDLIGVEEPLSPTGWRRYEPLRRNPSLRTVKWLRRFYYAPRSTEWYYSLFPREHISDRTAGDITPAYSTLDERGVKYARRVLKPSCRVVLIVRSPIDRAWSAMKMMYRWKGQEVPSEAVDQFLKEANHPGHRLRGDYARMIRLWGSSFNENFRVFRYDHLAAAPAEFLHEVADFLRVDIDPAFVSLRHRSNADPDRKPVPEPLQERLIATFRPEVEELDALLPGVAESWLAPAR